jgi:hypothetical protein
VIPGGKGGPIGFTPDPNVSFMIGVPELFVHCEQAISAITRKRKREQTLRNISGD